jgi:hypothetical protein
MPIDLNHRSAFVYGDHRPRAVSERINERIDSALVRQNQQQTPRTYLGASRIGEPCARKLVFELTRTPNMARQSGWNRASIRMRRGGRAME